MAARPPLVTAVDLLPMGAPEVPGIVDGVRPVDEPGLPPAWHTAQADSMVHRCSRLLRKSRRVSDDAASEPTASAPLGWASRVRRPAQMLSICHDFSSATVAY